MKRWNANLPALVLLFALLLCVAARRDGNGCRIYPAVPHTDTGPHVGSCESPLLTSAPCRRRCCVPALGWPYRLFLGLLLAVLMDASPVAEKMLYPLIVASQTIPTTALAPLFVLWFGYTIWSKVLVTVLITLFPIAITVFDGFRSVKTDMMDMLQTFGAGQREIFLKLKLPAALPYFFSAIKMAIPLSIIGAAIGEWLGAQAGLGISAGA